jgi:hypothetical protein
VLGLGLGYFAQKAAAMTSPAASSRLALENDEAPGHELAVVGNARRDREQCLDLGREGAGPASSIGLMERRVLSSSSASGMGLYPRRWDVLRLRIAAIA